MRLMYREHLFPDGMDVFVRKLEDVGLVMGKDMHYGRTSNGERTITIEEELMEVETVMEVVLGEGLPVWVGGGANQ